jgi:DNA-binding NtrC family response regulator
MNELILIVDDEPSILTALSNILRDEGFRTITTVRGEEALRLYQSDQPDVVFLDIWLPDRDGLETLQALRDIDPQAAVIMMSGHGTSSTAVKAIKMGAQDYLEKPLSYDLTIDAVRSALASRQHPGKPEVLAGSRDRTVPTRELAAAPELPLLVDSDEPQRTF